MPKLNFEFEFKFNETKNENNSKNKKGICPTRILIFLTFNV